MGADVGLVEHGIQIGVADARPPAAADKPEPGQPSLVGSSTGHGALEKIAQGYEQITQFEQHQSQALSALEEAGFVQRPEGENGPIICDLDRFRTRGLNFRELEKKMGPLATSPRYGDDSVVSIMSRTFNGLSVYSKEDYARLQSGEHVEAKPLFYIPKNAREALAESKARKADYYLGFWEVKTKLPQIYPTLEESNPVSPHETAVMQLVFNKRYGNGFRQDYGDHRLLVTYLNGKRRPISADFFRERGYHGNPVPENKVKLSNNPKEFIADNCPNVVKKGLISPDTDFRLISGIGSTSERFSQPRKPNKRGYVTVQGTGMRYNLGSEYGNGEYFVYKLSDKYAGVVHREKNGERIPVSVFGLEPSDTSKVTYRPEHAGKLTDVRKGAFPIVGTTEFTQENPNSATIFNQFNAYHEFCSRISSEAKLNLINLPLQDQSYALQAFERFKEDPRFWQLLKSQQFNGIKPLILSVRSNGDPETVLRLSAVPESSGLFKEASKIYDIITEYEESVRPTLPEDSRKKADAFAQMALEHTQSLITTGSLAADKKTEFTLTDTALGLRLSRDRIYRTFHQSYGLHEKDAMAEGVVSHLAATQKDPKARALAMELFEQSLLAGTDRIPTKEAVKQAYDFYHQNKELYESVSQTTGDTAREQQNFTEYVARRESSGKPLGKTLLDLGTGEQGRMATYIHEQHPDTHIVGVDLVQPQVAPDTGLTYVQADVTHIPLDDSSVDEATAFWSVFNDLNSKQRDHLTDELRRVMRVGGQVYIGTPHLEGGEGSWKIFAEEYHKTHRDKPLGTIEATIAGRKKTFFILPEAEIVAEFERDGFTLVDSVEWRTQAGKPRKDYVFELTNKQTPFR
jgi:ubiquinone/menaquinone biosynthesis C-methylase UbiE